MARAAGAPRVSGRSLLPGLLGVRTRSERRVSRGTRLARGAGGAAHTAVEYCRRAPGSGSAVYADHLVWAGERFAADFAGGAACEGTGGASETLLAGTYARACRSAGRRRVSSAANHLECATASQSSTANSDPTGL